MSPTLPQEMCDAIIDFLDDDPKTLAQVARVSRSWAPTSRKYLFKAVRISHVLAWSRFADCVRWNNDAGPLPRCTDYVQRLELEHPLPRLTPKIASLLGMLKNVCTLVLNDGVAIEFGRNEQLRNYFTKTVTSLILNGTTLTNVEELKALKLTVTGFPETRHLEIRNLMAVPTRLMTNDLLEDPELSWHNRSMAATTSVPLETVILDTGIFPLSSLIAEWLVNAPSAGGLRSLHIYRKFDNTLARMEAFNSLCAASRRTLEHLHFHISFMFLMNSVQAGE